MNTNTPLLTDLYQLTMAQAYWESGQLDTQAVFHMAFRQYPFKGGYAIACGLSQLAELLGNFIFDESDIEYLSRVPAPDGSLLFKPAFLEYLGAMKCELDVWAVPEGTVVFPHEPLVRVSGPILQGQILETPLLNCVSYQTLIATKAARVCQAAHAPVAEFGLRRAQGPAGGVYASRAAFVGGCSSTSNVLAGKQFGIPVSGTHAHSWVMSFPTELQAFRAYAQAFPNNCVLLVDTYDIETGIKNAITVGLEMRERGQHLSAIRIDSGDLSWLARMARKMLDSAGLTDCGICLSNDLDEYTISSILFEGVKVDSWGVGTKLSTASGQPSLGGVYKLAATQKGDGKWQRHMKFSASVEKRTIPGILDIRRYYNENGKLAGDMIFDTVSGVSEKEIIVDPFDDLRRKNLAGKQYNTLLKPLMQKGKVVLDDDYNNVVAARERTQRGLKTLDESQKRLFNPHTYPVGLEYSLYKSRRTLAEQLRGYKQ